MIKVANSGLSVYICLKVLYVLDFCLTLQDWEFWTFSGKHHHVSMGSFSETNFRK